MSNHGDKVVSEAGSSGVWKISNAQIICIQVVRHFDGVLMTMSPGRHVKRSHRELSVSPLR
jgi:hypothetical protein